MPPLHAVYVVHILHANHRRSILTISCGVGLYDDAMDLASADAADPVKLQFSPVVFPMFHRPRIHNIGIRHRFHPRIHNVGFRRHFHLLAFTVLGLTDFRHRHPG